MGRDLDPFIAQEGNLYRYVGNDPTNAIDPSGLAPTKKEQQGWKQLSEKYCDQMNELSAPRSPVFGIDRVKRNRLNRERENLASDLQGYWRGAYLEWARQQINLRRMYDWLISLHHSRWEQARKRGLTCLTWDQYRKGFPDYDKMREIAWENYLAVMEKRAEFIFMTHMKFAKGIVGNDGSNKIIWDRIKLDEYFKTTRFQEVMDWCREHLEDSEITNRKGYGDVDFKGCYKAWER